MSLLLFFSGAAGSPPAPPVPEYIPHGGGFGGGIGWSGGNIKPLRKHGEEVEIDPEDVRELLLVAFGLKKKPKPAALVQLAKEIPPHILALAANMAEALTAADRQMVMQAIAAAQDEEDVEMLLLGSSI